MIPESKEKIISMTKYYNKKEKAFMFFAYFEEKPIAGFIAFKCGNTLSLLYQGSNYSNDYQQKRPANNLYWYTIKWAKEQGYKWFDLAGVTLDAEENSKKAGILLYKSQFGGEICEFPGNFEFVAKPLIKKMVDVILPAYSKIALSYERRRKGA